LPLAEWLIEDGIGEIRALLIDGGAVRAARVMWPGERTAGDRLTGKLAAKLAGTRRGLALLDDGSEALVDHLPPGATEGHRLDLVITRAAIAESGRLKRAQARVVTQDGPGAPVPAPAPVAEGRTVRCFPGGLWEEVWGAAISGRLAFPGGEIIASVTPAMTVFDIDGAGTPREVALAAVSAIAQAIGWFDLGGNIGIDFPTLAARADRQAVDAALAAALGDWPHERTAMNGFGFVQLVARLDGPSLLHRCASARMAMCARFALRLAERAEGHGPVLALRVHPAVLAAVKPEWLAELRRRTGRNVTLSQDPGLAPDAPSAQILTA